MAGYYFIKSNGHLFRLTKAAYHAWVIDSANRANNSKVPAKLSHYGVDVGEFTDIKSAKDFDQADFVRLKKLFSEIDFATIT